MAVGSGGFLLVAFEHLTDLKKQKLGRPLDLTERAEIDQNQLFEIDIDGPAVEVTRFSLLSAILGNSDLTCASGGVFGGWSPGFC